MSSKELGLSFPTYACCVRGFFACPRSFGLDTLPGILQNLTVFLQQLPDEAAAVVCNQDLVGFFTSIFHCIVV